MSFSRYVALGDSFTEGVGDPDSALPNGVRGWADRVAGALTALDPDTRYANLAVRGLKLDPIIDTQVDAAIALEPDLVTIHAGGNDMLRPSVDLDALGARYDDAVGRLVATGATVVIFTPHDPGASKFFRPLRGRFALMAEIVRQITDHHSVTVVDYWRIRDYDDYRMWADDRIHMSSAGHQRMAIAVLDALGVAHDLEPLALPDSIPSGVGENIRWTREFLGPWVGRRLRGTSSGDDLEAKYPTWSAAPA
ncbi:SGNH/GDSL hydrolase family protein [Gordonia sp. HY285]|uniref:SGNH/GDSL hydrolase family protein n=1 Tax=Gordonia liuliyuniae TaxID=2911517 RepID=UPI001F3796AF|nr:SGNH/GDSL hydrolase family protein [Gordonia liuliyuniae]MCF8611238.1 SGNH/GDSL hydrolase family protein [Gordonia liuliyuniae]